MQSTPTYQPDGVGSALLSGRDPERFAGSTEHDQFHDRATIVVNRAGHDDHDDGLVHSHDWAAAK